VLTLPVRAGRSSRLRFERAPVEPLERNEETEADMLPSHSRLPANLLLTTYPDKPTLTAAKSRPPGELRVAPQLLLDAQ
jgi:hypothetical protein